MAFFLANVQICYPVLFLITICIILLDHVENLLCPVEPDIVVRYGHCLEGDLLGILEVGIRAPDSVEPFYRQQLILSASKEYKLTTFLFFIFNKSLFYRVTQINKFLGGALYTWASVLAKKIQSGAKWGTFDERKCRFYSPFLDMLEGSLSLWSVHSCPKKMSAT